MKSKTTLFALVMICSMRIFGQDLDSLWSIYDSLDRSQIHTGLLFDRTVYLHGYTTNPFIHDGRINGDVLFRRNFEDLYTLFATMQYEDTILVAPGVYDSLTYFESQQNYDVPIGFLNLQYQKIDTAALRLGDIGFDTANMRYYSIPNKNPYNNHQLFAGATFGGQLSPQFTRVSINSTTAPYFYSHDSIFFSVSFKLPSLLYYTNDKRIVHSMAIDFSNGEGFKPVVFDSQIIIDYNLIATLGENPWIDKILRLRQYVYDTINGQPVIDTLETRMNLTLAVGVNAPDATLTLGDLMIANPCQLNLPKGIGEAKTYVIYGSGNNNKIKKPVIMVEGFDGGYDRAYGNLTWIGFSTGYFSNGDGDNDLFPQLRLFPKLLDSLVSLGYDVLLVDHLNGLDWIEKNAGYTATLIQWLNEELVRNESDEEIVALGASMGGLICRYAVRKLELERCCHNVRLYGTFDSPHRGANIPLGIQKMVQTFAYNMLLSPLAKNMRRTFENLLMSPGAQQMLLYHVNAHSPLVPSKLFGNPQFYNYNIWRNVPENGNTQQINSDWMTMLDSIGHPKNAYKIGITNGSINGSNQGFGPSSVLFDLMLDVDAPISYPWNYQSWPTMGMKAYAVSTYANNLILERRGIARGILSYTLLTCDYGVFGAGWAARVLSFGLSDHLFEPAMAGLHQLNYNLQKDHRQNGVLLPVDGSPGSSTPTMKDLQNNMIDKARALFPNTMAKQDAHTFVPTIHALDLDTNDVLMTLHSKLPDFFKFNQIPFDSIWFPGTYDQEGNLLTSPNMVHVEISAENINWLIGMIESNRSILETPGVSNKYINLENTFNFGRPTRKFIRQVEVAAGGQLLVNHGGYGFDYAGSGQGPAPLAGSSFSVYTSPSNCDGSWVKVQNNGIFELGSSSTDGYVHVTKNTFVDLFPGSTLRLNRGSTFYLEPGAELIIHPGAVIDLAGPSAVLELQGKVTLMPNAVFSPTGSGFVRFAQAMQGSTDAPNYWSTNGQAQVRIVGSNGQKRAEVVENLYLTEVLDSVVFSQANTQIAAGKELHLVNVPVRLANSSFSAKDTTALHNGVHLYGQKAIVQNTRFSHGTVGLQANLNLNTKYIDLNGCSFTHNQTGAYLFNGGFIAEACTARYNQTGLQVFAATGNGLIQGGVYAHNTNVGIDASSAQNGQLTVLEAAVNNNTQGIHVNNMNLRSECSNISHNTQVGIAAENCFVQLQAGAQNQLLGNTYAIGLFDVYGIFLEDGLNDFSGSTSYINGNLTPINANPDINVNDNKMPGSPTALPIFVWFNNNGTWVYLPVVNWNSTVNLPTSCAPLPGLVGNTVAADAMRLFVSGKVINTTNYNNIWLHDALANAALLVSTSDHVYNDLLAIARFDEIFASISGSLTEMEMLAIEFATQLMVTALNNVYDQGLIPRNGAVDENPEHPYLHMVTANIHERLSATGINAEQLFNYNLLLAQTYRMAEHYDYALQILDSLNSSASNTQLLSSEYWACICDAEDRLLKQEIAPEDFVYEQDNCRQMLLALQKMQQELVHGYTAVSTSLANQKLIDIIFPNPVVDQLIISLVSQDLPAQITILDIAGKILLQQKVEPGSSPIILQTKHLAQGAYFVRVNQANREDVKRFVKTN